MWDAKDDDGDRVCALRGDAGISMSGAPSRSGISLIVDNDAWCFLNYGLLFSRSHKNDRTARNEKTRRKKTALRRQKDADFPSAPHRI